MGKQIPLTVQMGHHERCAASNVVEIQSFDVWNFCLDAKHIFVVDMSPTTTPDFNNTIYGMHGNLGSIVGRRCEKAFGNFPLAL